MINEREEFGVVSAVYPVTLYTFIRETSVSCSNMRRQPRLHKSQYPLFNLIQPNHAAAATTAAVRNMNAMSAWLILQRLINVSMFLAAQ